MNEQHRAALNERRIRSIEQASRLIWYPVNFCEHVFNIGISVSNNRDLETFSELDSSKLLDKLPQDSVISNSLDLIMISDHLFQAVTEHYTNHNITIDVMFFDQTVLSTTYNFNNQPF
jgi:hypothetical protein